MVLKEFNGLIRAVGELQAFRQSDFALGSINPLFLKVHRPQLKAKLLLAPHLSLRESVIIATEVAQL